MERKLHLIVSDIHREICEKMVGYAQDYAPSVGARISDVTWVPGTLEIPLVVSELIDHSEVEAFVILGVLEQGKTKHGEVIGNQVTKCLLDLQLQHRIPMAISIIGPGSTLEHANEKAKTTTEKAIRVALSVLKIQSDIRSKKAQPSSEMFFNGVSPPTL